MKNTKSKQKGSNKKAQTNQIFVYIFSIIVILFAGFLVTKFLYTFFDDTDKILENKFYDKFESDYNKVYSVYGSESVNKYKVTQQITLICFISEKSCISKLTNEKVTDDMKTDINTLYTQTGNNIIMFNNKNLQNSRKIGKFIIHTTETTDSEKCICITPKQGYFSLIFENQNNKVHIYTQ